MKPYDFKWSKFYEANSDFSFHGHELDLTDDELIICSTIIDEENFSILTTQKLITVENKRERAESLIGAIDKGYGDFKGHKDVQVTFGSVELENGDKMRYFIEIAMKAESKDIVYLRDSKSYELNATLHLTENEKTGFHDSDFTFHSK